jgi:N-acetylmuramoyl-L-alanine amidase
MIINSIVVHCSASPQGRGDDASTIHRWHLENGWSGIGYHYVILEDGEVQKGRPDYWTGAHASGHNVGSIGICLIGMGGDATREQMLSLRNLAKGLTHKHKGSRLFGHSDLDPINKPDCPGFNVKKWWSNTG